MTSTTDSKSDTETESTNDTPHVQLLNATPAPETVVCNAARNDYFDGWVAGTPLTDLLDDSDPTDEDIEWATDHLQARGGLKAYDMNIELWAKKRTLIRHLMDHGHFGPFEHPQATFAIKGVSRSCMAQLTRHRHATFDVQSMRYVAFDDVEPSDVREGELVVIPPSASDPNWVGRNQSSGPVEKEDAQKREAVFRQSVARSVEDYQQLLDLGMPPEDARFVLPIGTKVNIVMSLNLRMLMHVADMRAEADAQWEIRQLTNQVLDLAREWAPITMDYYKAELKGRKNRLAP